ncbi:MAG: M3 family oligoendopeptidase [Pseudobdellovibrionaceae bacterium]
MNLPAWDIESEYPSLNSTGFLADQKKAEMQMQQMTGLIQKVSQQLAHPQSDLTLELQKILLLHSEIRVLLSNLSTYVSCLENVDAKDEKAKAKSSEISNLKSTFAQSFKPVQIFLTTCDQKVFDPIFQKPELQGSLFTWQQERTLKNQMLSEKEEVLLTALSPTGFAAWGDLYFALSGTMKVKLELNGKTEQVGLAQAAGMVRSSQESLRKAAWQGIQLAWKEQQESAAAILNSLAGWRLEVCHKRSHTEPVDFLSTPLFQNRIQKETLTAMMTAVENNKSEIQEAALLMAKMHGKKKLDPWDLLAPAPLPHASGSTDFEVGLGQIRKAFASAHSEFGEFVDLMEKNKWLEARVLPNKGPGAHCTGFIKSRTPRVFQTYMGSHQDISTLAHELGHAYHSWVLKDLPLDQLDYPMTLAETASIFAETVLKDQLLATSQSREQKLEFAWADIEGAVSLLLNIPARYEFEYNFHQKRKERALSARELSELTDQAWKKWYGDTITQPDSMFWASKMHFSFHDASFYNFPYTFGYLFALSIYSRRKELGSDFWPKYKEILRDTGRMTAEDLILKHLGEDIRKPQFWQKSIDVVKGSIQNFKSLL